MSLTYNRALSIVSKNAPQQVERALNRKHNATTALLDVSNEAFGDLTGKHPSQYPKPVKRRLDAIEEEYRGFIIALAEDMQRDSS